MLVICWMIPVLGATVLVGMLLGAPPGRLSWLDQLPGGWGPDPGASMGAQGVVMAYMTKRETWCDSKKAATVDWMVAMARTGCAQTSWMAAARGLRHVIVLAMFRSTICHYV